MEFNGLPLHPLIVHVVVVFAPLAGVGGIVYALVPRWRWALRWPFVAAAVIAVIGAILAVQSGLWLENQRHLQSLPGMATHAYRGRILRWMLIGFLVPTALGAWFLGGPSPLISGAGGRRGVTGVLAWGIQVLLAISAVVVLVWVFLTGDAGARTLWGQ
ncbi:MAG: hypothetical protein J2P22_14165 [Nocardioides sp.]|nr:hypothetical protein [Nocardioides sp.]